MVRRLERLAGSGGVSSSIWRRSCRDSVAAIRGLHAAHRHARPVHRSRELAGSGARLRSPTADLSTTAALGVVVFWPFPFTASGLAGCWGICAILFSLPLLLPVEIITEFSRTLALSVRLFGNVSAKSS